MKPYWVSDPEMVVLLNILDFWWKTDRLPFPGAVAIGRRTGSTERTVRRHLKTLQKKGYAVKRREPEGDKPEFDFTGLINRLSAIVQAKTINDQTQRSSAG